MALDAEFIADRRRLRRKLSFWRVLAVAAAIAAVIVGGIAAAGRAGLPAGGAQIARIEVDGFIGDTDGRMAELFRRVSEAGQVRGVVIAIDSPGGTTTGAEELYRNIRRLSERKPLVAFVDGTAASGGYITALAADHIVARETSLVGSIGVLFQFPNFAGLLDRVGVQVEDVKSGPLKAEPSGYKPTSPEARAALQAIVNDTFGWFKGLVAERRKLDEAGVNAVSTGQVFSGRQGLPWRLVDGLGGGRGGIAWLEREKSVPTDLPGREWRPRRDRDGLDFFVAAAAGADLLGLSGAAESLRRAGSAVEAASAEGLLALWRPNLD